MQLGTPRMGLTKRRDAVTNSGMKQEKQSAYKFSLVIPFVPNDFT